MAWIELHQTLVGHPKTRRLARRLGVTVPAAVGHLACFWCWCIEYAQDGNLSRYEADELADAAMWEGDAEAFTQAMEAAGFIDQDDDGCRIHDWHDYAGRLVEKRAANAQRMREARARNVPNTCDARAGATVPNRTQPYLTKENPASPDETADAVALLTRIVNGLSVPDNAGLAHTIVHDALVAAGFACRREFPVPDRGNGQSGRLDILAHYGDVCLAIEIDSRTPRSKSIAKVRQIEGAVGVVILRGGEAREWPGVDLVLALKLASSSGPAEPEPEAFEPRRPEPAPKPSDKYSDEFEAFWQAYPRIRREDKPKCFKLWKAALATGTTVDELMAGLGRWLRSTKWTEEGGKYACAPAVWLGRDNRKWEDDPPAAAGVHIPMHLVPDIPQAPPLPVELAGEPWFSMLSKHVGADGPTPNAVMNFAYALGVQDIQGVAAVYRRDGIKAAGDLAWSRRRA